jgi:hypothetical protein
MKHCPTCGSSYTDDTLVYCLQDGATLRPPSQQSHPLSMVATLRDDTDRSEETQSVNNSSTPTVEISAGALPTTLYQEARPTVPVTGGGGGAALPLPTASAATPQPGSYTRIILTTVVVTMLLLAVGGVGAWMLFRRDGRWRERRAAQENANAALTNDSPGAANTTQPGNQTRSDNRPDRGGRWFVILASFQKEELNRANERLEVVRRQGFDARIMLSDDYPNFKSGLWLVGMGPYTRNQADEVLEQVRPKIKDAYTKSGW